MRCIWLASLALSSVVVANEEASPLPNLDLESLMATDVQVTSAMKRVQSTSKTAASLYVLTKNELINSGATSIPQALTLVPGMQVKKIDNNAWAVTSRGVAGRYSSKLLVMINGHSLHNPGFAGVDWESINIPLYDIERIEVIRGQGGLLWGSNATSGVINIITKHSEDTRSTFLQAEGGSQISHAVSARYGDDLGELGAFRVYASDKDSDKSSEAVHGNANDYGNTRSLGMRSDLNLDSQTTLLIQGDYTKVDNGQTLSLANLTTNQKERVASDYRRQDSQLMVRIENRISERSNQMMQLSYLGLDAESLFQNEAFDIVDLDYQMNTLIGSIQVDWGLNYRHTNIDSVDTDYLTALEPLDSMEQYGAFIQTRFDLIPEKLTLSVGNRSERNDLTGWEHQPAARLVWTRSEDTVFWSALSQGVRIPSLLEYNGLVRVSGVDSGIPGIYLPQYLVGSDEIKAEKSLSAEIGYRYQGADWCADLTFYYTKADDVLSISPAFESMVVYQYLGSNAELVTRGVESALKWRVDEGIVAELGASYSSYDYKLDQLEYGAVGDTTNLSQLFFKISAAITSNQQIFALYRLERGDAYSTDDYGVVDVSWSWKLRSRTTLSITGNNLFGGDHLEYLNTSETFTIPTYIEPTVVARISMEL